MATPIPINDPDDVRLEPYRAIQERDLVGRQGRFILEGEVVLRVQLQRGRLPLESVLLSERRLRGSDNLVASIPQDVPLYVAPDSIIEAIAGFPVHRGILGVGLKGVPLDTDQLLGHLPPRALVLTAIGIANHDNMGGLFRNAAAFGADVVLLDETCCDPLYRKAIRVSVGAALAIPFIRSGTASEMLSDLARHGFETFGFSPSGTTPLPRIKPPLRSALVLGAEGPGLPPSVMANMTTVSIPMAQNFDSLNVATASGIVLHHFFHR